MKLSLIVAANREGVIGKDNALVWHLPKDLKRFKKLTMGKPIIMGRKTFESIGKPLPGRTSIVVTRNRDYPSDGIVICPSLEEALKAARHTGADEAFVIGGGEIYSQAISLADRLYLTRVHENSDGDAFFHLPENNDWKETGRELHRADEKHAYDFEFLDFERK